MASSLVFHKGLSPPPRIASASGSSIWLDNGKQLLDACSGVGVSCLGYHDEQVAKAITAQLATIPYAYSSAFATETCELLANEILHDCPGGLSKAAFFCSGSEATEAALKIATQFWKEKGADRTRFISRKHSYHGSTIGALSVSGHTDRRAPYTHWLSNNVSFVDTCYPFRGKPEDTTEDEYVTELKNQLESEFQRLGPNNVAAFIAETIPGTALGCVPACKGYFSAVREVCDKHNALLILDEVCTKYHPQQVTKSTHISLGHVRYGENGKLSCLAAGRWFQRP
jgi:adenosylmethionine-8-amino-7-oxononanoate aminotransferase